MSEIPDIPDRLSARVVRSREMEDWMQATFIEGGPLYNEDHEHLNHARLGVLLTREKWERKGKRIVGEAREAAPKGSNAWTKARQQQQLRRWFGDDWGGKLPDFLITLDANYITDRLEDDDPYAVCALVEHELYHCAQKTDSDGMPAFDHSTGRPRWTIAPHDIEEFTGVARRYGAANDDLREIQQAMSEGPTVAEASVKAACGCGALVAA